MVSISDLKVWFADYVHRFDSGDPVVRENIDLKAVHTRRVCDVILDIGKSVGISGQELLVAEAAALLHDIGRFEQYRRYRTFVDSRSENHAALGVKIIKENKVLEGFDPASARIILRSVACHNRLGLPEEGDAGFLLILKLLRDADKVDIWRVVTEYYRNSDNHRNKAVELDLPDTCEISDAVHLALMNRKPVQMADLRTLNDFKLLQIGWIFDVNFPRTFQIVLERGYLEILRNSLPETSTRVDDIYGTARAYLERRGE